MTSPLDETTVYASVGRFPDAQSTDAQDGEPAPADFGPDEERLVARARAEALLRLARAL
jgi:hypothetical protein